MNYRSTFKTIIFCQLSDNCSFQSYLKPGRCYAQHQLSELTTVALRAIRSFQFFYLWLHHTVN